MAEKAVDGLSSKRTDPEENRRRGDLCAGGTVPAQDFVAGRQSKGAVNCPLMLGGQGEGTDGLVADCTVETFATVEDAVFGVDDAGVIVGAGVGPRWVRSD